TMFSIAGFCACALPGPWQLSQVMFCSVQLCDTGSTPVLWQPAQSLKFDRVFQSTCYGCPQSLFAVSGCHFCSLMLHCAGKTTSCPFTTPIKRCFQRCPITHLTSFSS